MPKKRFDVIVEIHELAQLKENWDSYGAVLIIPECMLETQLLFEAVFDLNEDIPMPSVVPCSNGHVQLEWHADGKDVEVEVCGELNFKYLLSNDHEGKSNSRKGVARLVSGSFLTKKHEIKGRQNETGS